MHDKTRQWHTEKSKHSEWTQWDEAKSGRLNLWAAPMIVQLQEATQYYYYREVLAIFPLTPDQIRAQIWPNGVRGGGTKLSHWQFISLHFILRNVLWWSSSVQFICFVDALSKTFITWQDTYISEDLSEERLEVIEATSSCLFPRLKLLGQVRRQLNDRRSIVQVTAQRDDLLRRC